MKPADKTEKGIRFGCGFVFGLLLFGFGSLWFIDLDRDEYVASVLIAAITFGLASLVFRDRFWQWFARWFSWFS